MTTAYRHTQRALWIVAVAAIVPSAIVLAYGPPLLLVATLVLCPLLAWWCSQMNVEVEDGRLRWSVGPPVWSKHVPLSEIAGARRVRSPWWHGIGIRWTPSGWLYSISGFDAVEVELRSGKRFRLGSDEPDALAAAIEKARSAR